MASLRLSAGITRMLRMKLAACLAVKVIFKYELDRSLSYGVFRFVPVTAYRACLARLASPVVKPTGTPPTRPRPPRFAHLGARGPGGSTGDPRGFKSTSRASMDSKGACWVARNDETRFLVPCTFNAADSGARRKVHAECERNVPGPSAAPLREVIRGRKLLSRKGNGV